MELSDVRLGLVCIGFVVASAGCRAKHPRAEPVATTAGELVLYRDGAVVRQAIAFDVPAERTPVVVHARLPIGVAPEDVIILERGQLAIGDVRAVPTLPSVAEPEPIPEVTEEPSESDPPDSDPPDLRPTTPTEVEIAVGAPRGHHVVHLAYVTDRISWEAAYTMTTTAARDRALVRGAIAIRNTTGVELANTALSVVDAELEGWRGRLRDELANVLAGTPVGSAPMATRHRLGTVDLRSGETRIELLPGDPPRPMRSVLVYDPFGTTLDNTSEVPLRDVALGATASRFVTESFEVERRARTSDGLPAGPVRLLERRRDGSLVMLGEARLFDTATRVSTVDTIAMGTGEGVTARRERVELTIDDDAKRVTEEFSIAIENTRAVPIDIVLREHAYRGLNWSLGFRSTADAILEGTQQFSMRTRVPANSRIKTVHVVVYWWR